MIELITCTFGPRYPEKEREWRAHENPQHAGCWVNDWYCGSSDCVMAEHEAKPKHIKRKAKRCFITEKRPTT